jgi:hypothetical protein
MMAKQALKEDCPHVIVCEGRDAENYLIWLLQALIVNDKAFDLFQVIDAGGIGDLSRYVAVIPELPNFSLIKTLTVMRDAETNAIDSERSVRNLLKKHRFAVPSSACTPCRPCPCDDERRVITGYALFPRFGKEAEDGTLEDLCLETLAKEDAEGRLRIVDGAISQVGEKFRELKCTHKNRLHTYLSLTNEFVTKKLGESARAGAFDFQAPALEPLKNFLRSMMDIADGGLSDQNAAGPRKMQ